MSTRRSIILVEPEEVVAEITSFRLELLGYQVALAVRGEKVAELTKANRPDLFIIDLRLPGLNGLSLIEQLTANEATSTIPVIAISFDADIDLVQQAFSAGASDYLVAPFDPLVLEDKVAKMIDAAPQRPAPAKV